VISARKAQNFESILSWNSEEIEPIRKLQPKRTTKNMDFLKITK
jgi:hypothetical protein